MYQLSNRSLFCKCCLPQRYYESPVWLSVCNHIVCRDTVVQFGDSYICPLCNSSSNQLDTESDGVRDIVNKMESKYFICPEHNQDTQVVCWTCNTHMCRFCLDEYCYTYDHDTKNLLESIKLMKILDENIKMFMQDNRITIQDNLDLLEQEIKNNKQIITRLRELKQYLDKRLDHHYLQSLETVFSILENRLLSSIDQFTETKKNITKYLDNFNSKKSVTQLLVQVLDWFKEKNRLCSYKIYSLTIKEYDIIDQLFNDYYKSEHSPTSPPTGQQQFLNTLNECIDIKESRDTRPLLCYPIINSYKFYDLPQHPIVDPINNSQLDYS